jgi:hypothetical protein
MEMVEFLSVLKLTNETDIFAALGGYANAISRWIGYQYIAGMWEQSLYHELL